MEIAPFRAMYLTDGQICIIIPCKSFRVYLQVKRTNTHISLVYLAHIPADKSSAFLHRAFIKSVCVCKGTLRVEFKEGFQMGFQSSKMIVSFLYKQEVMLAE